MNRSLLRTLPAGLIGLTGLTLGGTAFGADADRAACQAWHPHADVTGTTDAWNPTPAVVQPGDSWHPAAPPGTPADPWHRALPADAERGDTWHPAAPAGNAARRAWNPVAVSSVAC